MIWFLSDTGVIANISIWLEPTPALESVPLWSRFRFQLFWSISNIDSDSSKNRSHLTLTLEQILRQKSITKILSKLSLSQTLNSKAWSAGLSEESWWHQRRFDTKTRGGQTKRWGLFTIVAWQSYFNTFMFPWNTKEPRLQAAWSSILKPLRLKYPANPEKSLISPKALYRPLPLSSSMKCKAHFSRWGDKELVVEREKGKGQSKKRMGRSWSNCCNPLSASSAAMPAQLSPYGPGASLPLKTCTWGSLPVPFRGYQITNEGLWTSKSGKGIPGPGTGLGLLRFPTEFFFGPLSTSFVLPGALPCLCSVLSVD